MSTGVEKKMDILAGSFRCEACDRAAMGLRVVPEAVYCVFDRNFSHCGDIWKAACW